MKCLAILGGLSPEASAIYARLIHSEVRRLWGKTHSARLLIDILDQHDLIAHCRGGEWARLGDRLLLSASNLAKAGAEGLLLDSSTLHVVAPRVALGIEWPFFHVVDETAAELHRTNASCAGLLGTRCRAEEKIWIDRLQEFSGIDIVLPSREDRNLILEAIDAELIYGYVEESSRVDLIRVMKTLKRQGARAFILAAPELTHLADPRNPALPVIDSALLHARAAVRWALGIPQRDLPGSPCVFAHENPV